MWLGARIFAWACIRSTPVEERERVLATMPRRVFRISYARFFPNFPRSSNQPENLKYISLCLSRKMHVVLAK